MTRSHAECVQVFMSTRGMWMRRISEDQKQCLAAALNGLRFDSKGPAKS